MSGKNLLTLTVGFICFVIAAGSFVANSTAQTTVDTNTSIGDENSISVGDGNSLYIGNTNEIVQEAQNVYPNIFLGAYGYRSFGEYGQEGNYGENTQVLLRIEEKIDNLSVRLARIEDALKIAPLEPEKTYAPAETRKRDAKIYRVD